MSQTNTHSSSSTYSESRARYVMGKIFDDFHAIAYREFTYFKSNPNDLQRWKEDLFFLMTNQVLKKFQIQFFDHGKEWAIEYVIKADGSIHQDNDSGRVDYWEIPVNARPNIVVNRDYNKQTVNDYMKKRGWVSGGSYVGGDLIDDGAYSKSGFGATKGRRGAWKH